ncbi:MAG: hypothetical protein AAGF11_00675 [Myxococcota bacterium]
MMSSETQKLRIDVDVVPCPGGFELHDRRTGLELEVEVEPGVLDEHGVVLPGRHEQAVRDFLASVGLLDEGLDDQAIRTRQRQYLRSTREDRLIESINAALAFARDSIPYYRNTHTRRNHPDLASFGEAPLMRKRDVRLRLYDLLPDSLELDRGLSEGDLEWTATSGTTDERLQVVCSMAEVGLPEDCASLWGLQLPPTPRTAVLTSPTCMGTECHLGHAPYEARIRGQNTLYLNSATDLFSISDDRVRNIIEEIVQFEPDLLVVNPVYLHWVLLRARALALPMPRVSAVISTYQYLAQVQRRAIEHALRVPVLSMYTATELAGTRVALSCARGRLHVLEDNVHVEVVPSAYNLPNGVGHLAITTHSNRVMPLFRYLVGDVGRLVPHDCDCSYGHHPILEIHGRAKDIISVGERHVTTRMLDEAIGTPPGVELYQCAQIGRRSIELRVVPSWGERFDEVALREQVAELCGARIRLLEVRRLDPAPSLKFPLSENAGFGKAAGP